MLLLFGESAVEATELEASLFMENLERIGDTAPPFTFGRGERRGETKEGEGEGEEEVEVGVVLVGGRKGRVPLFFIFETESIGE